MRVLICGDRNWTDIIAIAREIQALPLDAVIVTGGARGADTIAHDFAAAHGNPTEVHYAQWEKHGKSAGPIRNQEMLACGLDLVLAFHPDLRASKGTADMVRRARKAGLEVRVFGG